jgi:hypothetical protein
VSLGVSYCCKTRLFAGCADCAPEDVAPVASPRSPGASEFRGTLAASNKLQETKLHAHQPTQTHSTGSLDPPLHLSSSHLQGLQSPRERVRFSNSSVRYGVAKMPNLPTASRGGVDMDSTTSDDPTKEAPGFIGTLSWLMIIVPVIVIIIGILYGLKRWGEESDAEAAAAAAAAENAGARTYHTARGGPRGWSGWGAGEQEGTELSGLLSVEEEDEEGEEREGEDAFGDGDSETTAVDGNIRTRDEGAGQSASGRWKLKREGFSTTAKEIKLKPPSLRGSRGRSSTRVGSSGRNGGLAETRTGHAAVVPPSGDKRD